MEDFEEMNQELLGMRNFIDTRYFGQVYYGKGFAFVYLREAEITIVTTEAKNGEQSNAEQSFSYKDVLGAAQKKSNSFKLLIYPKQKNGKRRLMTWKFKSEDAQIWVNKIQAYVNGKEENAEVYRRNFLVFINPVSGKGHAVHVWNSLKAMFSVAKCDVIRKVYLETIDQHTVKNTLQDAELENFDAILVVSGDGLIHDAFNILCTSRTDALNIPVVGIPGGSANAFSAALSDLAGEPCSPETLALIAIKGSQQAMDITKITLQNQNKIIYSFMTFTWAFIADVDIESEVCRWCGSCRFDCYGC